MNITTSALAIAALYNTKPGGFPQFGSMSSNNNLTSNLTNFTIPSAPLYNNVSAGGAWVIPASNYDLGARAMTCECFDPNLKCCMPASASHAPFCVAQNGTCCADTYCKANQTCCGDACCAPGFDCLFHSNATSLTPSCCPAGSYCDSEPICYDASSHACTNSFLAPSQCCPPSLPYCRSFKPMGLGCYASSSAPKGMTASFPLESSGPLSARPSWPTIVINYSDPTTKTLTLVSKSSGAFSLNSPTKGPISSGGSGVETTYVITFLPNNTSNSTSIGGHKSGTISATSRNHTHTSTATVTATTESHPITTAATSSKSTLCFNVDIGSPAPCPSTSADDGGFPGASTVSFGISCFPSLGLLVWFVGGLLLFTLAT